MPAAERKMAILAPWSQDAALRQKIAELRQAGEIVIQNMPGHDNEQDEFDFNRVVEFEDGVWILKNVG
jgi:ATP phosphoribosyltransferase regulatory subunit